ncbi:hypothetical protein ACO2Q1_02470 [Brevundimonas sp. VNH65]|uniref:hypothetical protein n=1 Tax=Brevundimonas sp. VNH65 TaxID=3400917 RepID=UPI003C10851D
MKVFRWSDGFHAYSVAVSSRPKALDAWGSDQDLFATGLASEIKDGPDFDAAIAAPGKVIRRAESVDIGKIEKAFKRKAAKGPSAVQKRKIEALQQDVEQIDRERDQALKALDEQIAALRQRWAAAEIDFGVRRDKAMTELRKARDR